MRKLGVIVFGASVFEYHDDLKNPRFANSAREFKKTIVDSTILADFETETLDLYNKSLSVSETLDRIHDFVGREFDDIIAYYCGHGDVGLRDGDYGVFLRRSNRERRHTLINFPSLIKGIKRTALRKRVYFILDACYAGSAVSEMETMDAGGTEALIGRRLMETVQDNGSGTAVLAASGRFGAALAKTEDRLTLFTGAFIKCLQEGIAHKTDAPAFSWLDIKDEVVRATQDRLGPNAPIPTLMSYSDSASDITRTSFFSNRAFVPRADGGKDGSWTTLDDRVTEHLYWKSISDESPVFVLEDFLTKFPNGIFSKPARAFLLRQIKLLDEKAIEEYLLDHPRSAVLETLEQRLGTLKWSRLKDGTELAEIEQFVRRFTRSEFVVDASLLIASIRTAQVHQRPPLDIASANSALSDALKAPIEDLKVANSPDMKEPASGEITQPLLASTERNPTKGILSRGGILLAAFVITLLVGLAGKFYSDGTDTAAREAKFSRDLAMAGNDVSTLKRIVDDCKKASCAVLSEASRRLADAQAAVEAAAREQQFRNDLAAAGTDVPKLKRLVDDCKKASCAVLSEANRRLADAQAAVEAAAREQQFRNDLEAAGTDVPKLKRLVDDCKKASCAVLSEANRRLADAQAAVEAAAREQQFRHDLAAAGTDIPKLKRIVDDCKKASCAVLSEANRRLADAQAAVEAAAREQQFRNDLEAAGTDVPKLKRIVDDCKKASCAVFSEAIRRLADAQAAVEAAMREQQFRNDLAAAGTDVPKLKRLVDDCKKASCAVLSEANRRLADAQAAVETAAREQQFRNDLAAAGTDISKLKRLVDDCKKASCAVLSEANRRLADAQAAVEAAMREQQFRNDLAAAGTDIPKLKRLVDDCKKASCAVLSEASRRLADAQAAVDAAMREQQFRNDLEAAGTDISKLKRLVDDCKKAFCAVLSEANRRLADAQAAVEAAMREQQFRNDLAAAGTDIPKLKRLVDDCKKASCAVLYEASRRLADAQTAVEAAMREQQFRNDLEAAGTDISKLKRLVDDCKKASCAVLSEASRRLADAQVVAVEAAMRELKFRNDLEAAGNDVERLSRFVDECRKEPCSVLDDAIGRLSKAKELVRPAQVRFATSTNYDMYGGDIDVKGDNGTLVKFVKSDATTCLANCRANRYCIAFVFDKWNSACYLKKQLSALTQTPRSDTSIRTDQQPFFETAKPHTCPYPNSSMRGNSISNFKSQSTEYCKRQCEDEKRCVAYMFQKRDGECTLLNSVSDRTRSDPAFDSGERTQNPNPC